MSRVILQAATLAAIYALVALSLNLQYGIAGLVNFGQGALFGLGGVAVAVGHLHGWPVWVGVVLGPIAGGLVGFLVSFPAGRLGEHYWGLLTIGMAELLLTVVRNEPFIAGGAHGTTGIPRIQEQLLLPILLTLIVVVVWAFERIRRSQFGRLMRIVREDYVIASAIGRDVSHLQAVVMAIGGFVAGGAGVAFGHWFTFFSVDIFELSAVIFLWAMVIMGGIGNNYGVVLGVFVVQALTTGIRFMPSYPFLPAEFWAVMEQFTVAGSLILFLIYRPRGLLRERRVRYDVDSQ